MRKWILAFALTLAFLVVALAQGTGSSNPSSSGSQTTSPQTEKTKSKHHASTGKDTTLTGCLSGPNEEGVYVLKNGRHKKGVEVGAAAGVDLKPHVGHEVKLTGMWEASGAAVGEKEEKAEKSEASERHFKADKVEHISNTCTATAGETTGKMKSKTKGKGSSTETPKS